MIYAAGGFDADEMDLNSMLRYDPSSDTVTWGEVAPIQCRRLAMSSVCSLLAAASMLSATLSAVFLVAWRSTKLSRIAGRLLESCSMAGRRDSFQTCVLTPQDNVFDAMRRALQ